MSGCVVVVACGLFLWSFLVFVRWCVVVLLREIHSGTLTSLGRGDAISGGIRA